MAQFRRLIIFEEPLHVRQISRIKPKDRDCVISFSASGKVLLHNKGIRSYFPDELVELPDLNRIGDENILCVKRICVFLDNKLRDKFVFLRENKMNITLANYFYIKLFIDVISTSYIILQRIFDRVTAQETIVFKKSNRLGELVEGRSSLIPPLIEKLFSEGRNLKVISNSGFVFNGNLYIARLRRLAVHLRDVIMAHGKIRRFTGNGLVLHNFHDIPYLIKEVLDSMNFYSIRLENGFIGLDPVRPFCPSIKIRCRKEDSCDALISEIFKEAQESKEYRAIFPGDDDLFYFANSCLKEYFMQTIGRILPRADYIKERLLSLSPQLLLTADCRPNMAGAFLLEMGRSFKIPIISYQEGGGAGFLNWPMFNIDMELSDYFLAYGSGAKEVVIQEAKKVVPTGSLRLARVKKDVKVNGLPRRKVIYVVLDAFKTGTWQHYPYNGGIFSQGYRNHLQIMDILDEFKTTSFVLKVIKGTEFLYEPFVDKGHIQIVSEPLVDVLNDASAFIVEAPATALLESILTDKPVALFYNPDCFSFEERALRLLSKRARIASDSGQLRKVIDALIKDLEFGTDMTTEKEFLEKYCLMDNTQELLRDFFNKLCLLKT